MPNQEPAYAILRTTVQRAFDLQSVDAHNNRTIPVLGSDKSVANGVRELRLLGVNAYNAVARRIDSAGAKWPGKHRIYCFEAVATFSEGANPVPPIEAVITRGVEFFDQTFGNENVVAIWAHLDEKTPHLHALVVPVCEALAPGRPCAKGAPKKQLVVSWNQFSGSIERVYRSADRCQAKVKQPRPELTAKCENKVMSRWQTEWAALWSDYGLRRGIPSRRGHLPMKWLHGQNARIAGLAEVTMATLANVVQDLNLSSRELQEFRDDPSNAVLSRLVAKRITPAIEECLAPMKELASRGLQLGVEKHARADIADKYEEAKIQLATRDSAVEAVGSANRELAAENARLTADIERLVAITALEPDTLLVQLQGLSDDEFEELAKARREARGGENEMAPKPRSFLRLRTPDIKTEPSPGHSL